MTRTPTPPGFTRGDFDTGFPLDDKVAELRGSTTPAGYHEAMSVYWHVVAAAWRKPERIPASRTCPDMPDAIADLVRVGLLDKAQRLPTSTFNAWIGRALASRASSTDRKRRNRSGMSRVTDAVSRGTDRDPREGREGQVDTSDTTTERGTTEGGPGGTSRYAPAGDFDALDVYHELTGYRPWGEFSGDALRGSIRDYTNAVVEEALRAEYARDGERNSLLKRTQARLAREAEHQRRAVAPSTRSRVPVDEDARKAALRVLVGGDK